MQKFEFLRQPLLGELAMSQKKERGGEREKMPFIVATYVYASSQGQRTHSARTNILINIYPDLHLPPCKLNKPILMCLNSLQTLVKTILFCTHVLQRCNKTILICTDPLQICGVSYAH